MTRLAATLLLAVVAASCGEPAGSATPGAPAAVKSSAEARAARRLFDGAPPVIPHQGFGAACLSCHERGMAVPDVGYAPTVPHDNVRPPGAMSRCRMCHVHAETDQVWRQSTFAGLAQDLRRGDRLHEFAPPVIPHDILLRENCKACHDGPAAREEIRCSHPERERCTQCHVPQTVRERFVR